MAVDYAVLASEMTSGPLAADCSEHLQSGNDTALAALFNTVAGNTIVLTVVDKNTFLNKVVAPAALALASASEVVQKKWDRILAIVVGAPGPFSLTNIQPILGLAVQDGLLTGEQITAALSRTASRAEVLFGPDTVLTIEDIARARRLL